jgi:DNA polymerase-3 subunit delta
MINMWGGGGVRATCQTAAVPTSPPPVTVVSGGEDLLVDRAVRQVIDAARTLDPEAEVAELYGVDLHTGDLAQLVAPSLFGGPPVVVIRGLEELPSKSEREEVVVAHDELLAYLKHPVDDACVVLVHAGGPSGRGLLNQAKAIGARQVDASMPAKYAEAARFRRQFVREEFQAAHRQVTPDAVELLVSSVGGDLRDLAAAAAQLASDTEGVVDEDVVRRYYAGRAEVTGFEVADRLLEGRAAAALESLRYLLAAEGVHKVAPIVVAAVARNLRALALVVAAPRGASAAMLSQSCGVPEWKIRNFYQPLTRNWGPDQVRDAIGLVADADAAVKGEAVDAEHAVEQMIVGVVRVLRPR